MSDKIKPCPFCGSGDYEYGFTRSEGVISGYTACGECDASICAASEAEAITAWNTRVEPKTSWQPIETAPKDGSIVLLTSTSDLWKYPFPAKWDKDFNWWVFADEPLNHIWSVSDLVTHWMPLPTPPEQDK